MRKMMYGAAMALLLMSTGATSALAATPANTIIIARNLDTTYTLDPHEIYEIQPSELVRSLYARIVDLDDKTFSKVVPGVAKEWSISEDRRTYTFTIDTTQKFHSGRNVTAEDVAFSLQRTATLARPLSFIVTQFGLNKDTAKQAIRAEGDKVIVTLDKAYAPDLFLNALTSSNGSVVDKELVLRNEKDGDWGNAWLRTNSAGGGAYRLVNYKPKESAVLQANPSFYLGAPKTRTIIVRHVAEPASQRLLLEKGDVDIAQDLGGDQIEGLKGNPEVKVQAIPIGTTFYLALNQRNPYLAKPEVWQAFRYLVDYDGIADNLLRGNYGVTQSFLAPGVNGAITDKPYALNVDKAKELLAKAGYPEGFRITMDSMPSNPHFPASQAIQASFAKAGIQVDIRVGEPLAVLTKFRKGEHDFIMFTKSIDYNDPNAMASYFARNSESAPKVPNWSNWSIPELTARTAEAAVEQDPAKRRAQYEAIQHEIQDNSPFVFVLRQITKIAMRSNVDGFRAGVPFDSGIYYQIEKSAQ